jgi:hypothetical protein
MLSRFSLVSQRFDDLAQGIAGSMLNSNGSHDLRYFTDLTFAMKMKVLLELQVLPHSLVRRVLARRRDL